MRPLLIAFTLLLVGPVVTAQQQSDAPRVGVLVGVHRVPFSLDSNGPLAASTLRTVWLDTAGTRTGDIPALLLPRRSGFWWLALESTCAEEPRLDVANDEPTGSYEVEIGDDLRALPLADRAATASSTACEARDVACDVDRRISIDWVWPEMISLDRGGEGSCGAHPDGYHEYSVHTIDDLSRRLPLGAVLGDAAGRRFQRAFDRAKLELAAEPDRKECSEKAMFSPSSWHLTRKDGHWRIAGWSETHRMCGVGIDYTIDADLTRFTRGQPRADALSSPDGRWVLRITADAVLLSPRGAPDRPVARVPLSEQDSVVMVEWATGRNVARWRDEVARLTAAPAR